MLITLKNYLFSLINDDQSNIIKTDHAFSGYAMSHKVELVDKKDVILQLEGSKSSIKDLFNDLLSETKGFKYQITVKVLLKKYKSNGEIEFAPVYFNSSTKTIINHRYKLDNLFKKFYIELMHGLIEDLVGLLN